MATYYTPGKVAYARDQVEKQLFKEVQRLIHYIEGRKKVTRDHGNPIVQSYEEMIKERCDVLSNLARL